MDWLASIVGGIIGFVASIGALTAEKIWDRCEKLRIFYRIRDGKEPVDKFGTANATDGSLTFIVPMVFEIQNTSNMMRILRDVSLNLYYKGSFMDEMIQIGQFGNDEKAKEYGGDKQSYSFVIQPRSIQKVVGTFMYVQKEDNENYDFDEIRIKYFDEKNRMKEHHIRFIKEPWSQRYIKGDDDWILVTNNSCCKKQKVHEEIIADSIPFTEEKISYLQMIQEPICRMSTISAIFKGFAATIVAGVATLAYREVNTGVLGLSFLPVLLFLFLDIYYLKLERKYRFLYEQVRINKHIVDFSMKLTNDNRAAKSRIIDCIGSPSIWLFYPIMITILCIVFVLKIKGVI